MYDVAIIGAGVVGAAIARELSRYEIQACVIEREEDVCGGTSKANSAIIHAGFDAVPGTLKAKLNVEGNARMDELAGDLDIPFVRNGSLVVCTETQDAAKLDELMEKAKKNGVPGVRLVEGEELAGLEPNLSGDVTKALYAPTGGIVCPFHMTMAFAENAFENGVEFFLNTQVEKLERGTEGYRLYVRKLPSGERAAKGARGRACTITARTVVNAAGVCGDTFNNMVSEHRFSILPRKGEYMLLDKTAGSHVSHTVFQLPGKLGKGVLVTPTVHGNLLIGPTAKDETNRDGVNTTAEGLDYLSRTAGLSVKNIPFREVITSFAGMRAHIASKDEALMYENAVCPMVSEEERTGDFVIGESPDAAGFFNAAGIESPGLTSAPAIAVMLAEQIADKLGLTEKKDFRKKRTGILRPDTLSVEERSALIQRQPAYGNIICRCEMISEGEILDAIHRPLGARSLDAVKRRTRAGMGRCQSGFCSPRTMEIIERETGCGMMDITKSGGRSVFVVGQNKEV